MSYDYTADLQGQIDAQAEEIAALKSQLADVQQPTVDQTIREAEAAGDWGRAGRLKMEQFYRTAAENEAAGQPVPTEETLAKIAELEAEGDYLGAAQAKMAASQPTAPTIDPEIAAQIAELEAEGKWVEAGQLKVAMVFPAGLS